MDRKKKAVAEEDDGRAPENNLTISTKRSTEGLICKSPRESRHEGGEMIAADTEENTTYLLYAGALQILFGLLMSVFGVLVIVHGASLAQLGGGLWGGCLAVASGTTGVLAAARTWCPLKSGAQRVAHTIFLALSLIGVAVSQLVLVLAATGLARDINRNDFPEGTAQDVTASLSDLPPNYLALLSNAGLLIVSGIECLCAAVISYRSSRSLCPCFVRDDGRKANEGQHQVDGKDAFVSSWLGKHALHQPPLYVVAAPPPPPSTTAGMRKTAMLTLPTTPPPIMGYPLIPAPLGPVPSPIIRVHPREEMARRKHHNRYCSVDRRVQKKPSSLRVHGKRKTEARAERTKQPTTEELVRTYTGLDRTIAEEFIEICNIRNNNNSDSSCCTSSSCTAACNRDGAVPPQKQNETTASSN